MEGWVGGLPCADIQFICYTAPDVVCVEDWISFFFFGGVVDWEVGDGH